MTKKQEKEQERQEAIDYLKSIIPVHSTVYTSLDYVSQSGMSRRIGVYVAKLDDKGKPYIQRITWHVARALDYSMKNDSLVVGGCGMDMGFHVVYSLARTLYNGNYKCTGEGCQSNDHVNGSMNPKNEHVGELHSDAGYSLNHQWL